jgi:uncharacterized membrane protein YccC
MIQPAQLETDSEPLRQAWRLTRSGLIWAMGEVAAVWRFEFLPVSWREAFGYGLRAWLACMLALYLSFLLQIDEPLWAGLTVWQGIQPAPGMAISRGFWRIVGVVIGSVMGVVLTALFPQSPELFMLSFALWIGACTVAATLLTNFRGFAAVSAGLLTAVVALEAYGIPNQVFTIAMARSAAAIIGIASATFVTVIFAPHRAQALMMKSVRQAISDASRRVAFPLEGALADRFALGPSMVGALIKLETLIEFAAKESAAGRNTASRARRLVAHLFAVITAKRALEEYLGRVGLVQDSGTVALYRGGMSLFEQVPPLLKEGKDAKIAEMTRAYLSQLEDHRPDSSLDEEQAISSQLVHDRLVELASHFERVMTIWVDVQSGGERGPVFHLNFHRDRLNAAISGMRSFLVILLGGIFWIESQWSAGPLFLIPMVIVSSIFAAAPYPEAVAFNFTRGVVCGIIAAYLCTHYLLVYTTGFVLFAASNALFLIPGAMVQTNPRYASLGLAFGTFFFLTGAPSNHMDFNPEEFFNNALAFFLGAFVATRAFRLFMPPCPRRAQRHVVSRMRDGLGDMAKRTPIPTYPDWQTRNFDRVYRLCDPANPAAVKTKTFEWYEGSLATMHLGNEVLRLRHLLEERALPERVAKLGQSILREFSKITVEPNSTCLTVQAANAALSVTPPPASYDSRLAWRRFRVVVEEIEAFFAVHTGFLSGTETSLTIPSYGTRN